MRNKQYRKHQEEQKKRKSLNYLAAEGKKEVIWSLRPDEVLQLAKEYKVVPYLYSIRTRKFSNIRYIKNKLLKDLHYSYKAGKEYLTCKLTKEDLNVLEEHGISCRVVKYRIFLSQKA